MISSDQIRMKKKKTPEAHSWKKGGKCFTDQTDGGGHGFMRKALRVETQSTDHLVLDGCAAEY